MKYARALKGLGALSMMAVATVVGAENVVFLLSQDGYVVSCSRVETGSSGCRTILLGGTTYEFLILGQRDILISKSATPCTTFWTDMQVFFFEQHVFNEPTGHLDMYQI